MPPRNMNPLPGKMPNGQDREVYTKQCHEFIEANYYKLQQYALFHARNDKDRAHDLCGKLCLILCEGTDNIDFTQSPLAYANLIIRRIKSHESIINQKKFERGLILNDLSPLDYMENSDVQKFTRSVSFHEEQACRDWKLFEKAMYESDYIRKMLPLLFDDLTPEEQMIIDWKLQGNKVKELGKKMNIPYFKIRAKVHKLFTRLRKKLIHLQGAL